MSATKIGVIALLLLSSALTGCGKTPGTAAYSSDGPAEERMVSHRPKPTKPAAKPERLVPVAVLKDGVMYPNGLDKPPLADNGAQQPDAGKASLHVELPVVSLGEAAERAVVTLRGSDGISLSHIDLGKSELQSEIAATNFNNLEQGSYRVVIESFDADDVLLVRNTKSVPLAADAVETVTL